MRFWIQYHNYDKLGYLPRNYKTKVSDLSSLDTRKFEASAITAGKRIICDAIGDAVFLIVGSGNVPKKYVLWSWCIIDSVEQSSDSTYDAFGRGQVLYPLPLLAGPEFDEFKEWMGRFGRGFSDITSAPYTKTLVALARERGDFRDGSDMGRKRKEVRVTSRR